MRTILALFLVLPACRLCTADEPHAMAKQAVNSLFNEKGASRFLKMLDDSVLRNGNPGPHKRAIARELSSLPSSLNHFLKLKEVRVLDFDNVEPSFDGLDQTRVKRAKQSVMGKYNNEQFYGIVAISEYRNPKPYKAINVMVFRRQDWMIVNLGDN